MRWVPGSAGRSVLLVPAKNDTLLFLLKGLGLDLSLLQKSRPDSIMAARLLLLKVHDRLLYDELKPYWSQVPLQRARADILSRAADMYHEHLQQTIEVPDPR